MVWNDRYLDALNRHPVRGREASRSLFFRTLHGLGGKSNGTLGIEVLSRHGELIFSIVSVRESFVRARQSLTRSTLRFDSW